LISIDSFTFDRSKAQTVNSTNDGNEYVGNVNFSIYGRGLTDDESNEITQELVDKIYNEFKKLKLELAKKPKPKPVKVYELKKQPDYNADVQIAQIDEHI
jgi:uncharacterized membrane-anchored protein